MKVLGWALGGNHSSGNGRAVKEGPDCIGTACETEQHAQPNQSHIREKVLLSVSNGPLDNHTGTKLLYLTLIAKAAAPPSESCMTPPMSPCHLPVYSQDLSLNGIHNRPLLYFHANCYFKACFVCVRYSVKRLPCLLPHHQLDRTLTHLVCSSPGPLLGVKGSAGVLVWKLFQNQSRSSLSTNMNLTRTFKQL